MSLFTSRGARRNQTNLLNSLWMNVLESYKSVTHDLCTSCSQNGPSSPGPCATLLNSRIRLSPDRFPIVNKPWRTARKSFTGAILKGLNPLSRAVFR